MKNGKKGIKYKFFFFIRIKVNFSNLESKGLTFFFGERKDDDRMIVFLHNQFDDFVDVTTWIVRVGLSVIIHFLFFPHSWC